MPRRSAAFFLGALFAATFLGASVVAAQEANVPTVILDTSGFWRCHLTLQTPVVSKDGVISKLPFPCETPPPASTWMQPDFDDTSWRRIRGGPFPSINSSWSLLSQWNVGAIGLNEGSTCLAVICMRGKFEVADPTLAKNLTVSVAYRGGVVMYLNGKEVARGHLPKGAVTTGTLAEEYPHEAYVSPDSELLNADHRKAKPYAERYKMRTRRIAAVDLPRTLLRKGINVLAVEVHRAPYPAFLVEEFKGQPGHAIPAALWDTCGVAAVRLEAKDPGGVISNVTRPKGFQAWNSDPLAPDFDLDFGDPNEPLRPITIEGARNGSFSGKVVLGSTEPIKGLRATISELTSATGGRISPSAVRLRYTLPTGGEAGAQGHYPAGASRFDALDETPPEEVPVRVKERGRGNWVTPGQPEPVFGAVQPVWLTVDVPPDASPGQYTGTLTLTADKVRPTRVPVKLTVHGWKIPDPQAFRTFVEVIQSPDSLALYYNVPLWSDRHFQLIEKSFRLLAQVGDRTVYVPLICHTNLGNEQTMVRWIKKPGGGYTYDFTVLDRYLDLYTKHLGDPEAVCLGVWETFLEGGMLRYPREGRYARPEIWEDFDKAKGLGPLVTALDGTTGKILDLQLPLYTDVAKSKPLWAPLFEQLRRHLKARGWEKRMVLGYPNDATPTKEVVDFFRDIVPDVPWLRQAHSGRKDLHGAPYLFQTLVWSPRFLVYPQTASGAGWRSRTVQFPRNIRNHYPLTTFRLIGEMNVMSSQRGFARLGGDFWPVLKNKSGRIVGTVANRYPKTRWRNLAIASSMLAPGEDGALATVRFEMMREGIQECEARIFIEEALLDEDKHQQLGDELAKRCRDALEERTLAILQGLSNHRTCGFQKTNIHGWWNTPGRVGYQWYIASGWQERSGTLYALAGEVANALKNR